MENPSYIRPQINVINETALIHYFTFSILITLSLYNSKSNKWGWKPMKMLILLGEGT